MAVLEIVEAPDKRLKMACEPVKDVNEEIRLLAKNMADTMYAAKGIGLAANQVGRTIQMLVCDVRPQEAQEENPDPNIPGLMTLINPKILTENGEIVWEEGCLSVPGVWEEVVRAEHITVEYTDLDGRRQTLEAHGILAICIQHEMDHLKGILFVDHLSLLKRKLAMRKLERFKREREKKQTENGAAGSGNPA